MAKTAAPLDVLAEIDQDLRAACADRDAAFRKLMVKDTQVNRDGYADTCEKVDDLLELRHDVVAGEG